MSEQLVGDGDLAVVGHDDFGWIIEGVAEEGSDVDVALLANHLNDAVVLHCLIADLRRLKGEPLHVPPLEGLRQDDRRLPYQHVEARVERHFLQLEIQVVERLEQETPHVHAGTAAVIGIEPRIDDENGSKTHVARNGVREGRVVMKAQRVQAKPMQRGRRLGGLGHLRASHVDLLPFLLHYRLLLLGIEWCRCYV